MEPFAAKTCLQALISRGMIIASFTTDRCSAISSMMLSDPVLAKICHEYDVWHWISEYFDTTPHFQVVLSAQIREGFKKKI